MAHDFEKRSLKNGEGRWCTDKKFVRAAEPHENLATASEGKVRVALDIARIRDGRQFIRVEEEQEFVIDLGRAESLVTFECGEALELQAVPGRDVFRKICNLWVQCYLAEAEVSFCRTWHTVLCYVPLQPVPGMKNRLGIRGALKSCLLGVSARELTVFLSPKVSKLDFLADAWRMWRNRT